MNIFKDFAKAVQKLPPESQALVMERMLRYPQRKWEYSDTHFCGIEAHLAYSCKMVYNTTRAKVFYDKDKRLLVACHNIYLGDALGRSGRYPLCLLAMYNPVHAKNHGRYKYVPSKKLPWKILDEIPDFFSKTIPEGWIPHFISAATKDESLAELILKAANWRQITKQVQNIHLARAIWHSAFWKGHEFIEEVLNELHPSVRIPMLAEYRNFAHFAKYLGTFTTDWHQLFKLTRVQLEEIRRHLILPPDINITLDESHLKRRCPINNVAVIYASPRDSIFLRRISSCIHARGMPSKEFWITGWVEGVDISAVVEQINSRFQTDIRIAL